MEPLIFKTNIISDKAVMLVDEVFSQTPEIYNWHVDREDVDRVMRIELAAVLPEQYVIQLMNKLGFKCEVLP
ncbi:hypothetical protein [Crocinitomix algicola]|uniref:hypothetical protein n=1 Tax=Crocinitomix algicola TaxID=1740263 RepID=UPI00082B57D3|nr:hypothetical protein [Crocinitomix algicola]